MMRSPFILLLAAVCELSAAGAAAADVTLISPHPEYLAPLVDRMKNHAFADGFHEGEILGQRVSIPDLQMPIGSVLASVAERASDSTVVLAIVEALSLPGGPIPGDIHIATRIQGPGDDVPVEMDLVRSLRLAGAEAVLFEVPPPGERLARRPLIVQGASLSRQDDDAEVSDSGPAGARVSDEMGYRIASSLLAGRAAWALVQPVVGWADAGPHAATQQRAVSNLSRLVLSYLKSLPTPAPAPPADFPPRFTRGAVLLRGAPDPAATTLGEFERGSPYQVLGSSADKAWTQVRLDDGREGWVMDASLERQALIVYDLPPEGGERVLFPREYDLDPHDATPANITRAVCKPEKPRFVSREHRPPPLCDGMIDSLEVAKDTVFVFLGPKSHALFYASEPPVWEGFLARLVYSLTENARLNVVRLWFTNETPFVPRILRREDFLTYWPTNDLREAAATHANEGVRKRARELLARRR